MRRAILVVILFVVAGAGFAGQDAADKGVPPIRVILVGDSTVAPKNGWGQGFCDLLVPQATCLNLGKNGRSSSSYRAEGSWDSVIKEMKSDSGYSATYVLVQFGHNDQPGKPGRSTDLATEFPANMRRYAKEVQSEGGHPVLVTPLTRRKFQDGKLENDLAPWAEATKKAAGEDGVPVLDLNAASFAAVQAMGCAEADTLAMAPPPAPAMQNADPGNTPANSKPATLFDYTHLGEKGWKFFGRMVADELVKALPELRPYFKQ
jgi:lysophospholipase L1-like esterase